MRCVPRPGSPARLVTFFERHATHHMLLAVWYGMAWEAMARGHPVSMRLFGLVHENPGVHQHRRQLDQRQANQGIRIIAADGLN